MHLESFDFVWGIKSGDDLHENDVAAGLYTLNDIDIIYDYEEGAHILSIETIYQFENGHDGEKEYLERLFKEFELWMIKNNHIIRERINLPHKVAFNDFNYIKGNSLWELYAKFKLLIEMF